MMVHFLFSQMLEDFATPPSSPPLGGVAGMLPEALRHHNIKASSVTWCTDYLEVMGCEKQHNFKVRALLIICRIHL